MRNRRRCRRSIAARRGLAATELALTLPLLLLLAFGCADLGRALAASEALSNATRVGAEYGATHGFTDHTEASWIAAIEQQVREEMSNTAGINSADIDIVVTPIDVPSGLDRVTVTASYPFSTISFWPGLPDEFTLRHSVTMQRFR